MTLNPFERVELGKTGLQVTRMGLGGAPLGGLFQSVGENEALETLRKAHKIGLNYFDTAPYYGSGRSETRFGEVLSGLDREAYVLSTKVGRVLDPATEADLATSDFKDNLMLKPVYDYSHDGVMRSIEESLTRLKLDRIDAVFIHDPDDHWESAIGQAYPALAKLREEGVIKAIGAGMNQAEMLARFAREGDFDCFLLAGRYTLLDQIGLEDLMPLCAQKDISIVIGGVYNSGILATGARPGATYDYVPAEPEMLQKTERIEAVCKAHQVPLKAAALQFPFAHPTVATTLLGARSVAELDENMALFSHPIPGDFWAELQAQKLIVPEAPLPT